MIPCTKKKKKKTVVPRLTYILYIILLIYYTYTILFCKCEWYFSLCFKVVFLFISTEVCKQILERLYSVDESVFTGPTHHRRIKPFIGTATGNISGMWDPRWTTVPGRSEVWKVQRCTQKRCTLEELSRTDQRLRIQCNMQNMHPVLSHESGLFPRTFWITFKHH